MLYVLQSDHNVILIPPLKSNVRCRNVSLCMQIGFIWNGNCISKGDALSTLTVLFPIALPCLVGNVACGTCNAILNVTFWIMVPVGYHVLWNVCWGSSKAKLYQQVSGSLASCNDGRVPRCGHTWVDFWLPLCLTG